MNTESLEDRIASLERANRRWRVGVGLAAAIAVGVAAAKPAADTTDLIRTRRLEVVDDAGTVIAKIVANTPDLPGGKIELYGPDGLKRLNLWATQDHGGFSVSSDESYTAVTPDQIMLYEQYQKAIADAMDEGKSRAELAHIIHDHERVTIGISAPRGGGYVRVHNPFGAVVAEMQSGKTNAGLIMAKDVDGTTIEALSGD